jgi:hypothetical protein
MSSQQTVLHSIYERFVRDDALPQAPRRAALESGITGSPDFDALAAEYSNASQATWQERRHIDERVAQSARHYALAPLVDRVATTENESVALAAAASMFAFRPDDDSSTVVSLARELLRFPSERVRWRAAEALRMRATRHRVEKARKPDLLSLVEVALRREPHREVTRKLTEARDLIAAL